MANLTFLDVKPAVFDYPIANGVTLVQNTFACLNLSTGRVVAAANTAGLIPLGIVLGPAAGSTSLTGNSGGTVKATILFRNVLQYAVTGVTGITDIGKDVFITNSTTLTLTRPSLGSIPFAVIVGYVSSTTCLIYIPNPAEVLASFRTQEKIMYLGVIPSTNLTGTAEQILNTLPCTEHIEITALHIIPCQSDVGAIAGSQTLRLYIGSTAVTGSDALAVYTGVDDNTTIGVPVIGAATANNVAHRGDSITLRCIAGGTGFTAGTVAAFQAYMLYRTNKGF